MATGKVIIYKGKLYFSDITVPTRVSQLANDAGYVTTDEKVKQTPTTSGGPYRILLSNDTDDTEHIDKVRKSSSLIYYPSGVMELTGTILGIETCKTTIQSYNIRINVTDDQNVSKYMDIWNDDISLSGNTWDGKNTSLKSAIDAFKLIKFDSSRLTDLNITPSNIRSSGKRLYIAAVPGTASNIPNISAGDKAGYCISFIWDNNNFATQLYICQGENSIYHRFHNNVNWQPWAKI